MPTVGLFQFNDITTTGPDPFSSDNVTNASAPGNSTFTIAPGAAVLVMTIADNDAIYSDADASQQTAAGYTINGTFFPAGTDFETEYSYVVRPLGSSDPADNLTIYIADIDADRQGIVADGDLVPGVTYAIVAAASNDPSVPWASVYVCFTAGTLIGTPRGARAVERLRPGDLVDTADNCAAPLRWVGGRTVAGLGRAAPVRFAAGVLGNARPLALSPQHRVLVREGGEERLVAAKALVGLPGITRAPAGAQRYLHLLFDRHKVIFAEGARVESLLPGRIALASLPAADRHRLLAAIATSGPGGLAGPEGLAGLAPARRIIRPGHWIRRGLRPV